MIIKGASGGKALSAGALRRDCHPHALHNRSVLLNYSWKDVSLPGTIDRPLIDRLGSSMSATLLAAVLMTAPALTIAPSPVVAASADISSKAVVEYQDLETAGKMKSFKALDDFRVKYNIKRTSDGRVQLKSKRGGWFSVRLDMEVPGALLLRSPDEKVYAVQTETLQQIDLSDDYVCLLMFADGFWEDTMTPIEYSDDSGKTQQLKLNEKDFREVIGILKETAEEQE